MTIKRNDGTALRAYSDLVVIALVLHVLIKLLLRVKLNPAQFQFLSYLEKKKEELVPAHFFYNDFNNTAFISETAGFA